MMNSTRKNAFWWFAIVVAIVSGAYVIAASEAGLASLSGSVQHPAPYTPTP